MSGTQRNPPQTTRGVPAEAVIERMQTEIGELHKRVAILEVQLEQAHQTQQETNDRADRQVRGSSEPG